MTTHTNSVNGANVWKWHARYPEFGTGPIPIEPYISPEYFEKERERIFRKVWLNVGRVEQIPNPGDYFVKDLAVCNTSIVIVRGEGGRCTPFTTCVCIAGIRSCGRPRAGVRRSRASITAGRMG